MEQIKNSEESMGDALKQGSAPLLAPCLCSDLSQLVSIKQEDIHEPRINQFPAFHTPNFHRFAGASRA